MPDGITDGITDGIIDGITDGIADVQTVEMPSGGTVGNPETGSAGMNVFIPAECEDIYKPYYSCKVALHKQFIS